MLAKRLGIFTGTGVVAAATIVGGFATPGAAAPTSVRTAASSPTGIHASVGATGELSLAEGVYKSRATNTRFTSGATRVASNATTVWQAGSTRAEAKGSFQFRIIERGKATGYWVLGTAVSGQYSWGLYPQHATCDISDGDPRAGGEKVSGDVEVGQVAELTAPVASTQVIDLGSLPTDAEGKPLPPADEKGFFGRMLEKVGL